MRKLLIGLVAGAVATSTAAYAEHVNYKITKIDAAAHTITLGNSQAYVVDPSVKLDGFMVGDRVLVTFSRDASGKNLATEVVKQ